VDRIETRSFPNRKYITRTFIMENVCLVLQGSNRCDTIIIVYKTEYISFVLYEFFLYNNLL